MRCACNCVCALFHVLGCGAVVAVDVRPRLWGDAGDRAAALWT